MNEAGEAQATARYKPGEMARIKIARNKLLEGKVVLIRSRYSATEWVVRMLDMPALVMAEDRSHYVATRALIADEWALEPLCRSGARSSEITDSTAQEARPQTAAAEECT